MQYIYTACIDNQGRRHEFEGGGSMHCKVGGGGQYSKNTKIWKSWGWTTPPPPSSYGGANPASNTNAS